MKALKLTAAALMFAGFAAHAEGPVKSEYFWQAEPATNVLNPELDFNTNKTSVDGGDFTTSGPTLNFHWEYGINEMLSAGAELGYINQTTDVTDQDETENSGMTDVGIFMKGQNAFVEGSSLHYGAMLTTSLTDAEIDEDGNKNGPTGGMTITPWVGYQWMLGTGTIGTKLSTDLLKGDRTVTVDQGGDTEEMEFSGGGTTRLAGFYEMPLESGLIGFEARYTTTQATETVDTPAVVMNDARTYMGVAVYPKFQVTETTTIVGAIEYDMLTTSELEEDYNLDGTEDTLEDVSGNILSIKVGGRFTF